MCHLSPKYCNSWQLSLTAILIYNDLQSLDDPFIGSISWQAHRFGESQLGALFFSPNPQEGLSEHMDLSDFADHVLTSMRVKIEHKAGRRPITSAN